MYACVEGATPSYRVPVTVWLKSAPHPLQLERGALSVAEKLLAPRKSPSRVNRTLQTPPVVTDAEKCPLSSRLPFMAPGWRPPMKTKTMSGESSCTLTESKSILTLPPPQLWRTALVVQLPEKLSSSQTESDPLQSWSMPSSQISSAPG